MVPRRKRKVPLELIRGRDATGAAFCGGLVILILCGDRAIRL
jgi:hypothetical protein